jgi:hypothetical protein
VRAEHRCVCQWLSETFPWPENAARARSEVLDYYDIITDVLDEGRVRDPWYESYASDDDNDADDDNEMESETSGEGGT